MKTVTGTENLILKRSTLHRWTDEGWKTVTIFGVDPIKHLDQHTDLTRRVVFPKLRVIR